MNCILKNKDTKHNLRFIFVLLLFCYPQLALELQAQTLSKGQLKFYTKDWKGKRYSDGRPKVSDDILQRMKRVSIEEAWGVLRANGYYNQFEGGWVKIHPDKPIIGRALTAQYMPARPRMQARITDKGHEKGRSGGMNSWPIDELKQGDVYVADGFGKIKGGTLIGDRLGSAIYANSGNGVIFNGSARDLEGLKKIDGFNAFVRDWDPSFLEHVMLMGLNTPIRIGNVTVLPGDVVLAKKEGVIFIPAFLAEKVVRRSEEIRLTDEFAHRRIDDGVYTPGQMDSQWTKKINEDFATWLEENKSSLPEKLHVGINVIKNLIKESTQSNASFDEEKPDQNG